ncbi:LuxR C-terminal-related transcriptional regulator [Arthrobacter sp. NEB 688]|uniref:helix-turn-helix transcriptional regulator n=1 Tax=Arthrobacter sp. NEB 688 TaxID=904039 RepID=UPI0015665BEC|nr:LuxR C-terminal-related transcriptional regulator [Arthrobacter sp. NEB 688]QKE83215.1 response regulator transcription factor [Arthrobacter sp. NEB 688]
MVVAGLRHTLPTLLPQAEIGPVEPTVFRLLEQRQPVDVILLDVELPDATDTAADVTFLTQRGVAVLLFSEYRAPHLVAKALEAGACGVVSKCADLPVLAAALVEVAAGRTSTSPDWARLLEDDDTWRVPDLTPRETEVVRHYAAGLKLGSVARRLNVSEDTTRTYLLRARAKYDTVGRPAPTKTDLYIRAVEDGILPVPGTLAHPGRRREFKAS